MSDPKIIDGKVVADLEALGEASYLGRKKAEALAAAETKLEQTNKLIEQAEATLADLRTSETKMINALKDREAEYQSDLSKDRDRVSQERRAFDIEVKEFRAAKEKYEAESLSIRKESDRVSGELRLIDQKLEEMRRAEHAAKLMLAESQFNKIRTETDLTAIAELNRRTESIKQSVDQDLKRIEDKRAIVAGMESQAQASIAEANRIRNEANKEKTEAVHARDMNSLYLQQLNRLIPVAQELHNIINGNIRNEKIRVAAVERAFSKPTNANA